MTSPSPSVASTCHGRAIRWSRADSYILSMAFLRLRASLIASESSGDNGVPFIASSVGLMGGFSAALSAAGGRIYRNRGAGVKLRTTASRRSRKASNISRRPRLVQNLKPNSGSSRIRRELVLADDAFQIFVADSLEQGHTFGFDVLCKECLAMDPPSSERSRSCEAMADVSQEPSQGHCGDGLLHRPNAHVWRSVLLFCHRPRPA